MGAETKKIQIEQETILDNIKDEVIMSEIKPETKEEKIEEPAIDEDKLAKLKAKLKEKEDSMKTTEEKKAMKKDRTINFGVIGTGQAGSRLAQQMYKLGYDSLAINTAAQDLEFIDIPESNKLLLDNSVGGSAKDLELGREMSEQYRDKIKSLISTNLAANDMLLI